METLADWIERDGSLTEKDAVGWVLRLAKRIEALHALGVAHGNISPACVCAEGAACSSRGVLVDVRDTAADPHYHSPERASGASLSAIDDVWALAATLYAAVTGQPPFGGTGEAEAHQRILSGTNPAPLAVFDVGDDELQRVFDAAFQRDPGRRTTRLAAFREALEKWSPEARALPPLEDGGDGEGEDEEDEDDDARTVMRGPVDVAGLLARGGAGSTGGPRAPNPQPNSAMGGPRAPHAPAGPLVGGPRVPNAPAGAGVAAGLVRPPGAPVPGPPGALGGPRAPVPPARAGVGAGPVRPPGVPVPGPMGGPRPPQASAGFGAGAPPPALAARTPHGVPAAPIGAAAVGGRPPGLGVHSPAPGFGPGAGPHRPLVRPPGAPAGAPPLGARSPAPVPPAPVRPADSEPPDSEDSAGDGELRTMMMFDAAKNLVGRPPGGHPAPLAIPDDVAVPRDDDDDAVKTTVAGSALSGGHGEDDGEEEEDDLAKTAMLMVPPGLADAHPARRPAAGSPGARAADAPPAGVFVYAGRSAAKPDAAASFADAEREAPPTAPAPPPAPLFGAGTPAPPLAKGPSEPTSPQERIARLLGQAGFEPGASLDGPPEGDGSGNLAATMAFDASGGGQAGLAAGPGPAAGAAAPQASPGAPPGAWSPGGGSPIAPFVAPAAAPGYQATASGQYPAVVAGPDGSLGPAPAIYAPAPVAPAAMEPAQSQTTGVKVALLAAFITLIVAALATILVMKSGLLR